MGEGTGEAGTEEGEMGGGEGHRRGEKDETRCSRGVFNYFNRAAERRGEARERGSRRLKMGVNARDNLHSVIW